MSCLQHLPEGTETKAAELLKLAIDTLESPEFKERAVKVLSSPDVRHGAIETDDVRHLKAPGMLARIEAAGAAGFSIDTKWTSSQLTNAWDGYGVDDPTCGRIILLSRSKVAVRPAYLWAGTVIHELSHKAGFYHDTQKREGNECTVPHLVGDLAEWTAYERARPAPDGADPFPTWETVCTAFAAVCQSDPHRRCQIGSWGVTNPP